MRRKADKGNSYDGNGYEGNGYEGNGSNSNGSKEGKHSFWIWLSFWVELAITIVLVYIASFSDISIVLLIGGMLLVELCTLALLTIEEGEDDEDVYKHNP